MPHHKEAANKIITEETPSQDLATETTETEG